MKDPKVKIKVLGTHNEDLGSFEVERGTRLFNALLNSGIDILNKCATKGSCGRCAVKFLSGEPETYTDAEQKLIYKWMFKGDGPVLDEPGVRASCQLYAMNDMEVKVLYRESEHDIKRSDKPLTEEIVPDPTWKKGYPSRTLPAGYIYPPPKTEQKKD